jgi:hypothetical protein
MLWLMCYRFDVRRQRPLRLTDGVVPADPEHLPVAKEILVVLRR